MGRAPSSGRSTGVTSLSDKLNPRGNGLPSVSYNGTPSSTVVGSGNEYTKENKGAGGFAIDANPYSWDTKDVSTRRVDGREMIYA